MTGKCHTLFRNDSIQPILVRNLLCIDTPVYSVGNQIVGLEYSQHTIPTIISVFVKNNNNINNNNKVTSVASNSTKQSKHKPGFSMTNRHAMNKL